MFYISTQAVWPTPALPDNWALVFFLMAADVTNHHESVIRFYCIVNPLSKVTCWCSCFVPKEMYPCHAVAVAQTQWEQ